MTSNSTHPSSPHRSKRTLILGAIALLVAGALAAVRWGRADVAPPPGIAEHIDVDAELRAEVVRLHGDIERSPRSAALRLELAMVLHANELAGLALEAYEQAISLGGDASEVLHLAAMARERTGDLASAVDTLQHVLRRSRPPLEAFWRQAQWLQDLGRLEDAAAVIEQGLRMYSEAPELHLLFVSVLLDRREASAAETMLRDRDLLRGAHTAHAHQLLARAAMQLGDSSMAERALSSASSARPVWSDAQGARLAQYRLGAQRRQLTVSRLMREGRYAAALPLLQELHAEDTVDPRTVNLLAAAHLRLGQAEEAVALLREAAQRHPDHYGTHLNLASALREIERPDQSHVREALVHAKRALALRPASAEAYELLGSLYARLGRTAEAVEMYEEAFELDARDPLRLLRAALLQRELSRWADAAESFVRSEALMSPPIPAAQAAIMHLGLAHCLIELGSFDDAKARLDRAASLLSAKDARLSALRDLLARRAAADSDHSPDQGTPP